MDKLFIKENNKPLGHKTSQKLYKHKKNKGKK